MLLVVDNGSTLQLVDNSSTQTAITYLPVSYTDNSFAYSPYQDWIITLSVAAGSLGTVAISSSINFTLSAADNSLTN